jgi:Xaa-Pro aminopeptidase
MLINQPRLQELMDRQGLDGLIAGTPQNVMYFTGIQRTEDSFAVITRDTPEEPIYIAPISVIDQSLDGFPSIKDNVGYGTFYRQILEGAVLTEQEKRAVEMSMEAPFVQSPLEGVLIALDKLGLGDKRVGFDEESSSHAFFCELGEKSKGVITPASDLIREIRMVKTELEVKRLQASARVIERALVALQGVVRPGISEYELAREFERSVVSQGARPDFSLIRIGRNAASHIIDPGETCLQQGESIWFDLGVIKEGYWADIARIFTLGEPDQRVRDFFKAMVVGEEAFIEAAKAGMMVKDLFQLTVEAVRDAGVPHYQRHHVGHGIGLDCYDPPVLTAKEETLLENNMVFCIETPYYEFGFGAVHVEDPVVIREGGNEVLTEFPRELIVID